MIFSVNDPLLIPEIGSTIDAEQAMALAINAAQRGAAFVSPNPLVGCVIVDRDHRFLGVGYHEKYGQAHAEVNALKSIKDQSVLHGATFYVTLEPCAHEGKTPSCAKALAKLPIKKVVYGLQDPNPLVSGQGTQILTVSGIEAVEYQGQLKKSLIELPEIFLKNFVQKKIFVAVKMATSLDAQMALASGESKWITGEHSREYAHELRSRYDAIVVGKNTILQDDPSLNIRHSKIQKENRIVILDRSRTIQKVIKQGRRFQFLKAHAAENIVFPEATLLPDVLQELWESGIKSVFVEGGGTLISQFVQNDLVDRLHLFMAPVILGSGAGRSWTNSLKITSMNEKIQLTNMQVKNLGTDVYLTGRFNLT